MQPYKTCYWLSDEFMPFSNGTTNHFLNCLNTCVTCSQSPKFIVATVSNPTWVLPATLACFRPAPTAAQSFLYHQDSTGKSLNLLTARLVDFFKWVVHTIIVPRARASNTVWIWSGHGLIVIFRLKHKLTEDWLTEDWLQAVCSMFPSYFPSADKNGRRVTMPKLLGSWQALSPPDPSAGQMFATLKEWWLTDSVIKSSVAAAVAWSPRGKEASKTAALPVVWLQYLSCTGPATLAVCVSNTETPSPPCCLARKFWSWPWR